MINESLKRVGTYYYILPTGKQARRVLWDGSDENGIRFLDAIPKRLIDGTYNHTEMKVRLKNGSLIQLIGSDNYDALAGTNPVGVVFSEYALQDPAGWDLIVSPILLKNGGWAVFNSTPRGKNHFFDLFMMAKNKPNWWISKLSVTDTGLITEAQLDQERAEGRSEELIQQEYYVSFDRGVEGSYYGRLIDQGRREGRVDLPVYIDWAQGVSTAWDLGFGDSTAIVFFQQPSPNRINIIDFYQDTGKGLADYAKVLDRKGYNYIKHFVPFDCNKGELSTGRSLRESAKSLGLSFTPVPKMPLEWGIDCVRSCLPNVWIDSRNCTELVKALEGYSKEYNEKLRCYNNIPKHDGFSHPADAIRYLCSATRLFASDGTGMSAKQVADLREKFRDRL